MDKLTVEDLNEILNQFVLGPTGECSLKMNPYIAFNVTRQLYDTMRENERLSGLYNAIMLCPSMSYRAFIDSDGKPEESITDKTAFSIRQSGQGRVEVEIFSQLPYKESGHGS